MEDLLDRLVKENKLELKDFKVEQSEGLDEIISCFEELIHQPYDFGNFMQFNCKLFPEKYSSEAITNFSLRLNKYYAEFDTRGSTPYYHLHNDSVSKYLNILVNSCNDKEYLIYTKGLDYKLSNIVSFKGKQVTVVGDLGNDIGCGMGGGSLVIQGNVERNLGLFIYSGLIIVTGTAFSISRDFESTRFFEIIVENNGGKYVDYFAKKPGTSISGKFPAKDLSTLRSVFSQSK